MEAPKIGEWEEVTAESSVFGNCTAVSAEEEAEKARAEVLAQAKAAARPARNPNGLESSKEDLLEGKVMNADDLAEKPKEMKDLSGRGGSTSFGKRARPGGAVKKKSLDD